MLSRSVVLKRCGRYMNGPCSDGLAVYSKSNLDIHPSPPKDQRLDNIVSAQICITSSPLVQTEFPN